jgi:cyclic pyranopterin monophosphate synthase
MNNKKKYHYKMIDVSNKYLSFRRACFYGSIKVGKKIIELIKDKKIEKGDPLSLSEISGINAVKQTSKILLLCHPINIENVFIYTNINENTYSIDIYCLVFSYSKTGVEMEAMFGLSTALMTIYDLTKKINPLSTITNMELIYKDGGETGIILNKDEVLPEFIKELLIKKENFNSINLVIITISDRASFGKYEDISGNIIKNFFSSRDAKVLHIFIVPDNKELLYKTFIKIISKYNPNLIISTGGTGISKRDITELVIKRLCNRFIPGIGEMLRNFGSNNTLNSWLSCSCAGIYKKTLIISLPGSPSGVTESLNIIKNILNHAIHIINK